MSQSNIDRFLSGLNLNSDSKTTSMDNTPGDSKTTSMDNTSSHLEIYPLNADETKKLLSKFFLDKNTNSVVAKAEQTLFTTTLYAMNTCVEDMMKYPHGEWQFKSAWVRLRILSTLYSQLTEVSKDFPTVDRPPAWMVRNQL